MKEPAVLFVPVVKDTKCSSCSECTLQTLLETCDSKRPVRVVGEVETGVLFVEALEISDLSRAIGTHGLVREVWVAEEVCHVAEL
jgi:hypothetical protein